MGITIRKCTYKIWKNGAEIKARFKGPASFKRSETYALMDRARVFAVDTESLTKDGRLTTLLTPVHFHDAGVTIETLDGRGMLHKLFEQVFARPGFAEHEEAPSDTAQRPKRQREPGSKAYRTNPERDGDRHSVDPVLSVWFNMPYDFGRLASDSPYMLRAVAAGAKSYRLTISDRFELEVRRMILGSAPSFDWRIRDKANKQIVRMLGIDLVGYWKTSLAKAAKAIGVTEKVDIEATIEGVYEKTFESFTPEEWRLFQLYGLGDVQTTLELYHRTTELLVQIDPGVVKKTGVIPPSAPGASAKIVFQKAFTCHPDIDSWERYPAWADQMGARAYFGGRAFCRRPGIFKRQKVVDLKSAYPFQTALLPDPVTVKMRAVRAGPFRLNDYRGTYGVLCVSGDGLDSMIPAFRQHDAERHGRLRYVAGPFERAWVTIPELVIGVVRGAIRIDQIHEGVVMQGSPEKSFLRAGIKDFFKIKEDHRLLNKALSDLAKLLANSLYGKLIEIITTDYLIAEVIPVCNFYEKQLVCEAIAAIFASAGEPDNLEDLYWGDTDEERAKALDAFHAFDSVGRFPVEKRGGHAVIDYMHALEWGGAAHEPDKYLPLSEFVRSFKDYKCGQYFFPLYGAQITGATSAMLGLMADCIDAYQGDTDSVHAPLPEGIHTLEEHPGFDRYFELMAEAGYPSPRVINGETIGGIPGISGLGTWESETPDPSTESVFVRPKVYSHAFAKADKGGSFHKQAKHGFARFDSPAVQLALSQTNEPREERFKKASVLRQANLHDAMKTLLTTGHYAYDAKRSPRKLREAIRSGLPVGEFTSRPMNMTLAPDPNTWTDEDGYVHWTRLGRL